MGLSARIAEFTVGMGIDTIPPQVVEKAKACVSERLWHRHWLS